ncbi:MAG: hypothetical protein RR475_03985 [Clostridia bacterium]
MKRFLDNLSAREGRRWALAAVLAAAVLLFAALSCTISYYDNDDLNIAWALYGYRSGTPSFSHPFINFIMAGVVSFLSLLIPRVPWWLVIQWVAMFCGMTAAFSAVFKISNHRGAPFLLSLVLCGLLVAGVYFYPVVLVTFTLSSTVLGIGGVALLLAADGQDSPKKQRCYWGLSIGYLCGSLLLRQSSGICVLCFWAGAALYRMVDALLCQRKQELSVQNDRPVRRAVVSVLTMALCATLLIMANAFGRAKLNPPGFIEFEEARAEYMDYPHDDINQNPALYASVGWDCELTNLTDAWFYMDERVNAENLMSIVENSTVRQLSFLQKLQRGWESIIVFLGKYPIAVYLLWMEGASLLALVVAFCGDRKRWLPFVTGLALTLGATVLMAYLCCMGRINLRTFMTVLFPTILCLLLLTCELYTRRVWVLAAFALLAGCVLLPGQRIFRTVLSYESDTAIAASRSVTDYVLAHSENVYFRDVYAANNFDALSVYAQQKPTNLIDWGGCDMHSATREKQMKVNGMVSPYADVFFMDHVYYICQPDDPYLDMLMAYMRKDWNASGYEIVDKIDENIAVVKFLSNGGR